MGVRYGVRAGWFPLFFLETEIKTEQTINSKMASENNSKKQEETSIDQLNSRLTSAGEHIANNKKIIFWAVGGLVIVAAFILSYLFIYKNPRTNRSFEAYNQVEISAMGNDSVAAAEYKKVADEYSGSDAGNLAALSAGEALYNEGKYEEAAKYLKEFSTSDEVLQANAYILNGDCYVNLKKYDEAISCYEKAVKEADGNDQIVPRALLKEANVYDAQKKYDMALGCYEKIKKEFPNFQLGNGIAIESYIEREKARLGK